mgnify:CR=1 FL=1
MPTHVNDITVIIKYRETYETIWVSYRSYNATNLKLTIPNKIQSLALV